MRTLESLGFFPLARAAVLKGLEAAAVLDTDGNAVAVSGALDATETRAVGAMITKCMQSEDLLARMLDGDWIKASLDDDKEATAVLCAGDN